MLQILVDADNLTAARLRALVDALPHGVEHGAEVVVVVAGAPAAIADLPWPPGARVHEIAGWQAADVVLVQAYRHVPGPLVIASGDGDFAQLARTHPGPVLVVSDRPASALRSAGTVVDPVTDGLDPLARWFEAVLGEQAG